MPVFYHTMKTFVIELDFKMRETVPRAHYPSIFKPWKTIECWLIKNTNGLRVCVQYDEKLGFGSIL